MYNKYLKPLYRAIFNNAEFRNDAVDKRIMQHITFLIGILGVTIGDYGYNYGTRGPISSDLSFDMDDLSKIDESTVPEVHFSEETLNAIDKIRQTVQAGYETDYSTPQWLELIASIVYLKQYVIPTTEGNKKLWKRLMKNQWWATEQHDWAYKTAEDIFLT